MGQNHQGGEFGNGKFCKNYYVIEIQKITYNVHVNVMNWIVKEARRVFIFLLFFQYSKETGCIVTSFRDVF